MKYDEKHPHWLVFVEAAPEQDDWYRLMVENPCNGQISTISTKIIDLEAPARVEDSPQLVPPPAP